MRRSRRDLGLGIAAAFLGLGHLFLVVGLVNYSYTFGLPAPWTRGAIGALQLVGQLVQTAGYAVISLAFLGHWQRRGPRFKAGVYVLAAGCAASLAPHVTFVVRILSLESPPFGGGGFEAALVIALASRFWWAVSGVIVASLTLPAPSSGRTMDATSANRRLAYVALGFALITGCALGIQIAGGYRVWLNVDGAVQWGSGGWAASAFLFSAAVIAAIAFFTSTHPRTGSSLDRLRRRETLLILAAASLLAFAVIAVKSPSIVAPVPGAAYAAAVLAALIGMVLSRRSLEHLEADEPAREPLSGRSPTD